MDIFTQKKFLVVTIIVLAALNLSLMVFLLCKDIFHSYPPPPPPALQSENHDISGVLERELNLTPKQVEQIKKLRSDFFEKENELVSLIRSERDSMNEAMFNKFTDEDLVKSLARRIAENEFKMELLRFEQAQQLKSICTPEQLEKFKVLVREIRDYFKPENQPQQAGNPPPRLENRDPPPPR
jgi:Spy/CpxP family protein refolding chaperone